MSILKGFGPKVSQPQTTQVRADQVENNAGGFVFELDATQRLIRFLVLGVDSGTYYASAKKLAKENVDFLIPALEADPDLVNVIREVSVAGRAPKQSATLFALAAATASANPDTKKKALGAITDICRTATMLFEFLGYVQQFRGWGRALATAVAKWYEDKPTEALAYQAVKYRSREGWTHRDVMRKAHPSGVDTTLGNWILGHPTDTDALPNIVNGYLLAQVDGANYVDLINNYNLPWEALPDAALAQPEVWEALIPKMGLTALIRNLGRMSNIGLLKPLSGASKTLCGRLVDAEQLAKARIHPFNVLVAQATYASGHGFKGKLTWTPDNKVVDALEDAYYLSFGTITPANKRTLIGLDVSGSMTMGNILGSPLTPREGAAAMAMVTVRTEADYHVMGFCGEFVPISMTAKSSLGDVIKITSDLPFGRTDCAQPMLWAAKNKIEVDTFITITDSETWAGSVHPFQALNQYRQSSGIAARNIVVGMTATNFTVNDPGDPLGLDVIGFDSSTPDLMASFSRGDF